MSGFELFKIDKDIPIPVASRTCRYPIADLAVGDSFFVPGRTPHAVQSVVVYWQRKLGTRYLTRSVEIDGARGVRIWRVE